MRRLFAVTALAVATTVLTAGPAAADPAGPTHYDSVVTGIDGPDGVEQRIDVEVLGGDAFLVVHAAPGTVVEVPGYEGEPYVRIDADGSVFVNERSESRYVNEDRYGAAGAELPAVADNDAAPTWVEEADVGSYAWHDHRIHFMSPELPRQVDAALGQRQVVWDWSVPLVVDGEPVEVTGELAWVPGPSPAMPAALVAIAVLVAVGLVWRWRAALVPLLGVLVVVTAAVGAVKMVGLPPGADGEPALLVLPAIAFLGLAAGLSLAGRRPAAALLVPAAGIPILVWGVLQGGALLRPIVPGPIDVGLVRLVVAAALAAGVAALVAGTRDVLALTAVGIDEVPEEHPAAGA